ncbi:MAG TPA: FecR domain-containing protein [Thermoanaerobaculia bacterium]|nr:FecR domain-containing protein [Thermoanaerobaculia bacterium]
MAGRLKDPRRNWYSISVDTLRTLGVLLVAAGLLLVGARYFHQWEQKALAREASRVIDEARGKLDAYEQIAGADQRKVFEEARGLITEAEAAYRKESYRAAIESAKRARATLGSLFEIPSDSGKGAANFVTVQGTVEFRRGENGDWQPAKSRISLEPGDYVRTSSGSAEIVFADGTFYTVRANTLFIVASVRGADGGEEQSIRMDYGWVDLSTRTKPSQIATPGAQARVRESSEAFVSYDREAGKGRFGAVRGGLDLASSTGLKRSVGELEQVVQSGGQLSAAESLPGVPRLSEPADQLEVDFDPGLDRREAGKLALGWEPVSGATHYALQVGRNHLFVDNVIDVASRTKTRATLGVRGEGNFVWRVAAVDSDGVQGPWSEARKFRVAAVSGGSGDGGDASGAVARRAAPDRTPPQLDLEDIKPYGTVLIVGGKTEPGARVSINGEPVEVDLDGSFNKAIQMSREGWSTLEIRAVDSDGNPKILHRKVFVGAS